MAFREALTHDNRFIYEKHNVVAYVFSRCGLNTYFVHRTAVDFSGIAAAQRENENLIRLRSTSAVLVFDEISIPESEETLI